MGMGERLRVEIATVGESKKDNERKKEKKKDESDWRGYVARTAEKSDDSTYISAFVIAEC